MTKRGESCIWFMSDSVEKMRQIDAVTWMLMNVSCATNSNSNSRQKFPIMLEF